MKFIKKEVFIEAVLFDGKQQSVLDIMSMVGADMNIAIETADGFKELYIHTPQSRRTVPVGLWVVKNFWGEVYAMKDEDFQKAYQQFK